MVSPEVTTFVESARRFADFIHSAGKLSLTERLAKAREQLLELYSAGTVLPSVEPPEGVEAGPSPDAPAD